MPAPLSYRNVQLAKTGRDWETIEECALYTDAWILGQPAESGVYQFVNCVCGEPNEVSSRILMRCYSYFPKDWRAIDYDNREERTDDEAYHGGGSLDEIAALVALTLGIRCQAGAVSRVFERDGPPLGTPTLYMSRPPPTLPPIKSSRRVVPQASRDTNIDKIGLVHRAFDLKESDAIALIKAARLYQAAIWVADSDPSNSWLLLSSAVETVANAWRKKKYPSEKRVDDAFPELRKILADLPPEKFRQVASIIAPLSGATSKFVEFICSHLPKEPDGRPEYGWMRFPLDNEEALREALKQIYAYRSRALHAGIPFPLPMCEPPLYQEGAFSEVPHGLAMYTAMAKWMREDTPMLLHTFHHLVRGAILEWFLNLEAK